MRQNHWPKTWHLLGLAYLVILHAVLAVALFMPSFLDAQRWRWAPLQRSPLILSQSLLPYFKAQGAQIEPGHIIFVGDSQCHRFVPPSRLI